MPKIKELALSKIKNIKVKGLLYEYMDNPGKENIGKLMSKLNKKELEELSKVVKESITEGFSILGCE